VRVHEHLQNAGVHLIPKSGKFPSLAGPIFRMNLCFGFLSYWFHCFRQIFMMAGIHDMKIYLSFNICLISQKKIANRMKKKTHNFPTNAQPPPNDSSALKRKWKFPDNKLVQNVRTVKPFGIHKRTNVWLTTLHTSWTACWERITLNNVIFTIVVWTHSK
jgi:hypothetical protein